MEYMRFADVAQAQGLPLKLAYKVSEVSKVLGIVRPEHVDQWLREGER